MQVFKSKIDVWLVLVLAIAVLISLFSVAVAVYQVAPTVVILLVLPVMLLFFWVFLTTRYEVSGSLLCVHSGPFHWNIEIESIQSITETRNPFASPALSLDRVLIEYGDNKRIMVSPKDKQGFYDAIRSRG